MNKKSANIFSRFRKSPRRGFTLVEATLSVAIVGVLITASGATFGTIARSQRVQAERQQGYMLAQQLMGEIEQTYFIDPSSNPPTGGAGRTSYTDVADYNGFTESTPTLRDGTILTDYTNWSRGVATTFVNPTSPSSVVASSTLQCITVTVTSPSGKQYVLVGLRSQYGAYEATPTQQLNYVTGVVVAVKGGTMNKSIYTTAHPLNVSTSQ